MLALILYKNNIQHGCTLGIYSTKEKALALILYKNNIQQVMTIFVSLY